MRENPNFSIFENIRDFKSKCHGVTRVKAANFRITHAIIYSGNKCQLQVHNLNHYMEILGHIPSYIIILTRIIWYGVIITI